MRKISSLLGRMLGNAIAIFIMLLTIAIAITLVALVILGICCVWKAILGV